MPFKLPEHILPKGMMTDHALDHLLSSIEVEVEAHTFSWCTVLSRALSPLNVTSLFPWISALCGIAQALFLLSVSITEQSGWFGAQAGIILVMSLANLILNCHEQKLRVIERKSRVQHVANQLRQAKEQIHWSPANYPHLHTPLAASIVLQWTIRDKTLVNLPWALLVEKDLVLIKPGQAVPGSCHSYENPKLRMKQGEILHIKTHTDQVISPTPEFKTPAVPQLFVMDETPYANVIRRVLQFHEEEKPPSILSKLSYFFFTKMLVHILLPIFAIFTILWNILRHNQDWSFYGAKNLAHLFIVDPIAVTLPLLSLTFPVSWTLVNYMGLAWILGVYTSSRHMKMTDDPFDDTLDVPEMKSENKVSYLQMLGYFSSALFGKGEYLSRTENIVHTLGSITALCCSDKKGLLSWPNASPEKIFIVKKVPTVEAAAVSEKGDCPEKDFDLVPEILTVTHSHHNPFRVEFDDPLWQKYMNFLKPLGLGILLNTCNISTEEKYTNFFNHLICESIRVGDASSTTEDEKQQQQQQQVGIDMLPIVTRGCLCELASKIGFSSQVATQYSLDSQIQTFRHVQPSLNDKFARNLSRARLKFPFPHLVSVIVQHRATGARQLISQGTADIVLDSCTDFWSGSDLEVLTEDIRKKMLDFYQRASLSSYCTAFALRPHTFSLPWNDCREYLQLPTHSNPFYWHHSELSECVDADAVTSHISSGTKAEGDLSAGDKRDDHYVKTKEDAMLCLELECNQTFLGMIQLQYQAVVDMVQLIDLLEKACIRFVHFSKENELRSRVFSEKMGLESGWNCHISLKSNKLPTYETIVCDDGGTEAQGGMRKHNRLGSSLPDYLNRPAWFLDFPKWKAHGAWNNGEQISSTARLMNEEEVKDSEPEDKVSSHHSRHASVNSDSDPFEYDMNNRAQLPRGIENIRPHLETMDNVPLLVSLFTDCTPAATISMLHIMQDYGEVVCVMGSSANYRNIDIFLQSNASLAIEPRYPQLCQRVPVSSPTKAGPSPAAISQLLISVASSLSFKMEDEISIFHLILESRHFTLSLINALKFWICCLVTISCLQFFSLVFTLPLFITTATACLDHLPTFQGQTLWMTLLIVPLLSLSLMGLKTDATIMTISTGKNAINLSFDSVKYAVWCYGTRFVPSIAILVLCHLLSVIDLRNSCSALGFEAVAEALDANSTTCSPLSSLDADVSVTELLDLPQHLNFVFAFLYLTCCSMSFISRSHQLWERHPGHNKAWLLAIAFLFCVITCLTAFTTSMVKRIYLASLHVWIVWFCGLLLVVGINEVVKRLEIKVDVRYQKRERLEFGTKLGMNSPF